MYNPYSLNILYFNPSHYSFKSLLILCNWPNIFLLTYKIVCFEKLQPIVKNLILSE